MRHALLVLVLLLSALAPPAAATSHLHLEMDVRDATGDARAFPDVRLPQTDIARFTMTTEGDEVVQTVQVVGPWPDNNYWVEVRNSFGGSEALTLKVERTNSSGGNPQPTDYNSSLVQTLDPARMGTRVSFQFERTATTLTFRWPVSAIPPAAQCVTPAVTTLSRTLVDGRSTQVDDKLEVTPDLCQDALPDGLTGTCPAPRANVVAAGTLADDRGDVGERQGLGFA
ncbi:MAG TPA: hypothetical protein VM582_01305, partial [Candidatus Thermoplasmatota archaeon]|nr:hypothetical protein [Candidatus Thermoplasmatota archaeon]